MRSSRNRSGFTMIEIMLVLSIIGLLAVILIPAIRKAWMHAEDAAFVSDLRTWVNTAIEPYAINNGQYPPDAAPGVLPDGIGEYVRDSDGWSEPTPIGGRWDWDRAESREDLVHGVYACLSVVNPRRTSAQMRRIDEQIDDGNLSTGLFRMHSQGYMYVLE